MEILTESNLIKCKACGILRHRIQDGQFNARDKRWRDEHGGMWSGRTCPKCHREKILLKKKEKKNENSNPQQG